MAAGPQGQKKIQREMAAHHDMAGPASADPLIGTNISRYAIEKRLGKGAMGSVYRASDESGRKVAVKILESTITDMEAVERFLREVASAKKVNHPNILKIHERGVYGDMLYCVMEYLEGHDLSIEIKKGATENGVRMPWERAKKILLQICDGVYAVHKNGIMHRDLKPHNVFLAREDGKEVIKVVDFGLAKMEKGDDLTETGTFLGTAQYMAPEMTVGKKDMDYRVDIYAVGVMMYELLVGKVPFKGNGLLDTMKMHREDPVPLPRLIHNDIPEAAEKIILRAMAKKPENRFQSMREMRDAIELVGDESALGHILARDSISDYRKGARPVKGMAFGGLEDLEEEPEEERGSGGWLGKIFVSGVVAAGIAAGYTFKDDISAYIGNHFEDPTRIIQIEKKEITPDIPKIPKPVEKKTFEATIESAPAGAVVYGPDGKELGNTKEPLRLTLDEGEYLLLLKKPGYLRKRIVISQQNTEVKAVLKPIRRRRSNIKADPVEDTEEELIQEIEEGE